MQVTNMIATKRVFPFAYLAGILILMVSGCAPKPIIRSDFDPSTDFKGYHTFGFFDKLATDDKGYETLISKYLKSAVTRQMKSRGYRYQKNDPDVLFNFKIKLQEKQQVRTSPGPYGYYGYRYGYYGAWGGYNNTYVYDYTEGTLNIDMVDRKCKQMVWEGAAIGRVNQKDYDNLQLTADKAVDLIFRDFPVSIQPAG